VQVKVDEETGIVTETVESPDGWFLCVNGETGSVNWVEML
jgi:hypothetical protein